MADYKGLASELIAMLSKDKGEKGRLGYEVNGAWRVIDQDDPNKYYVRLNHNTMISAFHRNQVMQTPDLPVRVGTNNLGQPIILGVDEDLNTLFGGSPGSNVGPHDHVRGSGREYIIDTWLLKQLRCSIVSGTTVKVAEGPYFHESALRWWAEDTVDLASYVPDFGFQRWVVIVIDPVSVSLVVLPGAIVYGDSPMDAAATLDVLGITDGYLPIAAIWLNGGESDLHNYQIEDIRFLESTHSDMLEFLSELSDVSSVSGYYGYPLKWDGDEWTPEPTLPISNVTLSDPPTPAEVDTAFGVAGQASGFAGHINSGGTGDVYRLFVRDQGTWVMYNGVALVSAPTIDEPDELEYTPDLTPTFEWTAG